MAEPIMMPFGIQSHVGQRNNVLDGVHIFTGRNAFFITIRQGNSESPDKLFLLYITLHYIEII